MEREGLIAPRIESFWRVNPRETRPDPEDNEVVMMKSHVERGLSLPPSDFFSEAMLFYAVNPQHLSPNAILTLSGFQALHEGYLGVRPTMELFEYYYMAKRMPVELNIMRTCGSMCFKIRPNRRYPEIPGHESVRDWTGTYFYLHDKAAPGKKFGIPPFVSGPATPPIQQRMCRSPVPQTSRGVPKQYLVSKENTTPRFLLLGTSVVCFLRISLSPG